MNTGQVQRKPLKVIGRLCTGCFQILSLQWGKVVLDLMGSRIFTSLCKFQSNNSGKDTWHEFWVHDRYATFNHLQERKKVIEDLQFQYPESNGMYIIWEENNAGSKDATDWTRSMANVIRTGITHNIKGCLEPHNANGMSDLLTTNLIQANPAARRPIWWVYYMFSQLSGEYVDVLTEGTDEFTAAACMDEDELKIVFAKMIVPDQLN